VIVNVSVLGCEIPQTGKSDLRAMNLHWMNRAENYDDIRKLYLKNSILHLAHHVLIIT